ncbi:hypothetical protein C5B85_01915 [Pseudoclavibacter sp. AY1F1]|uniref:hypothetical protein n=1 Tax=Pseudoclavibacter sp. AY1F1 TaxID=2080583 RepID=UPI000CE7E981|nr:hypothetical protein [Pseudoclavibacter sp. AY1F1]PPF47056.1 hypothetical protein C5B85_01915 [Pseudoclavibacter sp. AY1F1]
MPTPADRPKYQPSPRALATRSLRLAEQLRKNGQPEAYRQAMTAHVTNFAASARTPRTGRACPMRSA